jgi:hypothetical protein
MIAANFFARTRLTGTSIIFHQSRSLRQAQYFTAKRFVSSTGRQEPSKESITPPHDQHNYADTDQEINLSFYAIPLNTIDRADNEEQEEDCQPTQTHDLDVSISDFIHRPQGNNESNAEQFLENINLSAICDIPDRNQNDSSHESTNQGGDQSFSMLLEKGIDNITLDNDHIAEEDETLAERHQNAADITTVSGFSMQRQHQEVPITEMSMLCQPCDQNHDTSIVYKRHFDKLYTNYAIETLGILKNEYSGYKRRPLLSIVTKCMTREEANNLMDININKKEWAGANKHAIFPGAGKANLPRPIYFRKRMEEEVVSEFVQWLHASNCLQNLSFGHKVVQYCNGVHTAIEAVKLTKSIRRIIQSYSQTWIDDIVSDRDVNHMSELGENTDDNADFGERILINENGSRCTTSCLKSKRQCLLPKDHHLFPEERIRHCFTPKGQLSPSSIEKILGQLTAGKIRSLAGLDDTDVEKGTQNFHQMKSIVRTLTEVGMFGRGGDSQAELLIKRIEKMEEFHKVGFPRHLGHGKYHSLEFVLFSKYQLR